MDPIFLINGTIQKTGLTNKPRRVVRNGRTYLVLPLTSIVPGVLPGSQGPLFYPPEEVRNSVKSWDNTPLVVYHPTDSLGNPISARADPGVLKNSGVGFVKKSVYNSKELTHEAWFDIKKLQRIDNNLDKSIRILPRLKSGKPIEISTGLFTRNEPAPPGSAYNGRQYDYVAREYRPDHIAILPDQVGACSNNDGCGVNINRNNPIKGGVGDSTLPSEVDKGELEAGIKVEMEHTKDRDKAKDIALDHLTEDPHYYTKLKKVENVNPNDPLPTVTNVWTDEARAAAAASKKAQSVIRRSTTGGGTEGGIGGGGSTGGTSGSSSTQSIVHKMGAVASSIAEHAGSHTIGLDITSMPSSALTARMAFELAAYAHELVALLHKDDKKSAASHKKAAEAHKKAAEAINKELTSRTSKDSGSKDSKDSGATVTNVSSMSHDELRSKLREKLGSKFKQNEPSPWIREVYDDYIIYHYSDGLFKQKYSVSNDGQVTLSKDKAERVIQKVSYECVDNVDSSVVTDNTSSNVESNMGTQNREDVIKYLVTNCDCWKGKEKVLANKENFSDEDLIKLKNGVESSKKNEVVANAAKSLKLKIKPAHKASEVVFDESKNEFVTNSSDEVDDDDDDDNDDDDDKTKKGKKGAKAPMTANEWLQSAPPQIQEVVSNAMDITNAEKTKLVQRLVANVSDAPRKEQLTKSLMTKKLTELREMAELLGPVSNNTTPRNRIVFDSPTYLGAGGGPVDNFNRTQELDDLLEIPVLNYGSEKDK